MCETAKFVMAQCPNPDKHTHIIERNGSVTIYTPLCDTYEATLAVIQGFGAPTAAQRRTVEVMTKVILSHNRAAEIYYYNQLRPVTKATVEDIIRRIGEQPDLFG